MHIHAGKLHMHTSNICITLTQHTVHTYKITQTYVHPCIHAYMHIFTRASNHACIHAYIYLFSALFNDLFIGLVIVYTVVDQHLEYDLNNYSF